MIVDKARRGTVRPVSDVTVQMAGQPVWHVISNLPDALDVALKWTEERLTEPCQITRSHLFWLDA